MKPYQDLQELAVHLRAFAAERNWEQYHSPKNIASALIVEAAELLEHFQWKTEQKSRELNQEEKEEVGHELADVLIYLTRMADILDIDLLKAATEKMEMNRNKYPAQGKQG